jgi:hypothetical protein
VLVHDDRRRLRDALVLAVGPLLHHAYPGIRPVQNPALGDRQNRLSFLTDPAKIAHETVQRLERDPLAPPGNHHPRFDGHGAFARPRRVTELITAFHFVHVAQRVSVAPCPSVPEHRGDDLRLAAEGHLRRGHVRRHEGDEIVFTHYAVHQPDERFPDVGATFHRHLPHVEEDDEDARASASDLLLCLAHGSRIAAERLRPGRRDEDALEGADLLAHAVLEDLKVLDAQILHGAAAPRRVGVHAHVIGLGAEGRGLLALIGRGRRTRRIGGWLLSRERDGGGDHEPEPHREGRQTCSVAHRPPRRQAERYGWQP